MSAVTVDTHYNKHHAGYVKKLNAALKERANAPSTLEDIVRLAAREEDDKLFNNAAQAWNHAFFWQSLKPDGKGEPSGKFKAALDAAFGSFSTLRDEFLERGEGHFASGWVWLVAERGGKVRLVDTHDAHTPMVDRDVTPLITCDVWEHAYYLDHKNERGAFLKAFVDHLANWRFAERQYEAARAGGAGGWIYPH
jgi:Fe-Mn family superoxide dismutase